jgi:hypothetical protein
MPADIIFSAALEARYWIFLPSIGWSHFGFSRIATEPAPEETLMMRGVPVSEINVRLKYSELYLEGLKMGYAPVDLASRG